VAPGTEQLVTLGVQPGGRQMCFVGSQNLPEGQLPQSSAPSQPSPMLPQYWPPWKLQVSLLQFGLPQTPATLALQAVPAGQLLPQSMLPLQPSPITPQ